MSQTDTDPTPRLVPVSFCEVTLLISRIESKDMKIAIIVTNTNITYTKYFETKAVNQCSDQSVIMIVHPVLKSCTVFCAWQVFHLGRFHSGFLFNQEKQFTHTPRIGDKTRRRQRWRRQWVSAANQGPQMLRLLRKWRLSTLGLVICHFVSCMRGYKCLRWQRLVITSRFSDVHKV